MSKNWYVGEKRTGSLSIKSLIPVYRHDTWVYDAITRRYANQTFQRQNIGGYEH